MKEEDFNKVATKMLGETGEVYMPMRPDEFQTWFVALNGKTGHVIGSDDDEEEFFLSDSWETLDNGPLFYAINGTSAAKRHMHDVGERFQNLSSCNPVMHTASYCNQQCTDCFDKHKDGLMDGTPQPVVNDDFDFCSPDDAADELFRKFGNDELNKHKLMIGTTIRKLDEEFGGVVVRFVRQTPFVFNEKFILVMCNARYDGIVADKWTLKKIRELAEFKDTPVKHVEKYKYMDYAVSSMGGFRTLPMKVEKQDVDVGLNYNDDLPDGEIVDFINGDKSGLVIFHGEPGTGKSSYIRSLIYRTSHRFLFMDKSMFGAITSAEFISFLIERKSSVIVLEDCENLLKERDACNSALATLLNLSDGILGDSLRLKFICTFNADLHSIDPAVLRKGRLRMKYEFGKLEKSKVKTLCEKLGVEDTFNEDTALCEIYNMKQNDVSPAKASKIGF